MGKAVFAERCARCHSSKIPAPAPGVDPGGCSGKDYLDLLEQILGVDEDGRIQIRHAQDCPAEGLSEGQLSLDGVARSRNAAADERMQSARDECNRREYLGQLLLADLQGSSVGRIDHRLSIPITGSAEHLSNAGRRTRLYSARFSDQRVVDGAIPAKQQRRKFQSRAPRSRRA